jgi:TonB family protein
VVPTKVRTQLAISTPVIPPPARSKAVSLSPLKERLARENRERQEQTRRNHQLTDRVTQLKLDLQQQRAEEQAREATRLAREAIAETYRVTPPPVQLPEGNVAKPRTRESTTPGPGGSAKEVSPEVQSAYAAGLRGHIGRHWSLPDLQGWDKSLKTVISIKMKANGMVAPGGVTIATPSGNPRFDKEARKAVNNSLPLPPLPPEFGKNGEEIAVTFTPGGLK